MAAGWHLIPGVRSRGFSEQETSGDTKTQLPRRIGDTGESAKGLLGENPGIAVYLNSCPDGFAERSKLPLPALEFLTKPSALAATLGPSLFALTLWGRCYQLVPIISSKQTISRPESYSFMFATNSSKQEP